MLPPIEPEVASANPKFDALYRDLCSNKLGANGTSVVDGKAQKERETLNEELHKARVESARRDFITRGLHDLAYTPAALPEELQDLVATVAAVLEGQVAEEDLLLLHDDVAKFKSNIKAITAALSKTQREDADLLVGMLDLDKSLTLETLPQAITDLRTSTSDARSKAASTRLALAQEVSALHSTYRRIMEASIRILEQTIHGAVARGTKAKAECLALVAEGMSKKLELQHGQLVSPIYSEEVQEALKGRAASLEKETKAVKGKVREAEERLEEYRKARGMEGMAKEYAEILGETERVRAEIERLENE
ncbi:uncharacterized protein LTR77_000358 [Saxophila tyrrhenica]|uniref:Uncharacterized protein n=1 Tax=Saxophila tyrrhenica TaxID=1690608 RepID=A0AAV9PNC3_9PEZI|nr:hypothetical protein LTR77_000358 [Saxophila tyrrhenica]